MIKFEFDEAGLQKVEKKLGAMKSEAPRALKNALNATAKDARKDLANKARETYTVKIGGFNSQMKIERASTGNLVAIIRSQGAPLELKKFSVQGGRRGSAMTTQINKKHGRKSWGGNAFVNNIARNGQTRKRGTAKGAAGSAVSHVAAAVRHGSRLPIKKLFSVSVPQMIGNEKDVYGVVKPHIQENLQKNIDAQVAKILRG